TRGPFGGSRHARCLTPDRHRRRCGGHLRVGGGAGAGRRAHPSEPSHGRGAVGYPPCLTKLAAPADNGVSYITITTAEPGNPPELTCLPTRSPLGERPYEETHMSHETSHYGRQRASLAWLFGNRWSLFMVN